MTDLAAVEKLTAKQKAALLYLARYERLGECAELVSSATGDEGGGGPCVNHLTAQSLRVRGLIDWEWQWNPAESSVFLTDAGHAYIAENLEG